jgi:hypothetical protein
MSFCVQNLHQKNQNSNEKGDMWVQHFILYNYLKTNKVQKFKFDIFPLIGETSNINIWG